MSQWHEIKPEDIGVDLSLQEDKQTIDIFVFQEPDWGNHYAVIKIVDLISKLKEYGKI